MKRVRMCFCFLFCMIFLMACGSDKEKKVEKGNGTRDNTPVILIPEASGEKVMGMETIQFDLSHSEEGYVIVEYTGDNPKVKVRIQNPNEEDPYTYDVRDGQNIYPLTGGNGSYTFSAYENIDGTKYSQLFTESVELSIANDYITYLYPNAYVYYTPETKAIALGQEIAEGADTDLDVVAYVYDYMVNHIRYDDEKADAVKDGQMVGYLPDVDEILEKKKGICFDYVAVMATMLRTQNIPTRMEIGYAQMSEGAVYHAWISVYIQEIGWIDDLIQFDGKHWSMMDPTLISDGNNSQKIRDFTKDASNYITKFLY